MADAFSVGNTIKHMLTGVSPNKNVDEIIALENNPFVVLCSYMCGFCKKDASTKNRVQYRAVKNIPTEAVRLIRNMTHFDPQQRTSVRTARLYPWIDDVLVDYPSPMSQTIEYLSFACKTDTTAAGVSRQENVDASN